MHRALVCKISIPAFSTSPEPRQEEEALYAAREIERLSAEVSFFPLAREGRQRSASEPAFPPPSRFRRMEQESCGIRRSASSSVVGGQECRTLGGGIEAVSDPSDLSLRFSSYSVTRSTDLGKGLSPAITFLPRSYSFPPIRCVPATSKDGDSPERTQDSFPVYSPPNPTDLARLRFPAGFVIHADRTPPLDHHLNAWLSPKYFALNSPPSPSPRMHRRVEESPTQTKVIRRKPVPKLLVEDFVRNSSFMRFSTMKSFPLIQPTDILRTPPSVVAQAFRRSDQVRGYSLRYFLSQGAQGKVYLATSGDEQEKLSAIKVISKLTVESFRTLLQEQKLLRRIKGHQFVLNMVDSFHDTENFYLVTDYYPGGDLSHLLYKLGVFETDMARFYISELIVAVKFLHDREIVHRDLKPGNILIKSDGHICVVDFGLCKDFRGTSTSRHCVSGRLSYETKSCSTWPTTNGFAGTLVYMSPQAVNQDPYSYETDWWAMGIILYELLQGDTPWVGSDISSMVKKIRRDPLVFRKDVQVNPAARDFIEKLLKKEVKSRISPAQFERHGFFQSAKFADVQAGLLTPPFTPLYDKQFLASGCLDESDKIYVGRPYDPTVDPFPEYNYANSLPSSSGVVDVPDLAKLAVDKSGSISSIGPPYQAVIALAPRSRLKRPLACTKPRNPNTALVEKGSACPKSISKLLNLPTGNTLGQLQLDGTDSTHATKSSLLPRVTSSLCRLSTAFSRSVLYSDHFAGTSALDTLAPAVAISPPPVSQAYATPPSPSIGHPASHTPPAPVFTSKASPLRLPTPSLTPPLPSMLTVSSIRGASSLFSAGMDGSATHTTILSSYTTSILADMSSVSAAGSSVSRGITQGTDTKKPTSASPLLNPEAPCKTYEAGSVGTQARGPLFIAEPPNAPTTTIFTKWFATVGKAFARLMRRIKGRFRGGSPMRGDLTV